MEVPTVIGLGLGFDGTSNWINKNVVDKYVLGVDEFKPEEYGLLRKFLVLWVFLTVFTYLLYFTLCPLVYHFLYARRDENGENVAAWNYREGRDQVRNEIKLSAWSIAVMAGMTAPFELMVEKGWTKIYWDVPASDDLGGWFYLLVGSPLLFLAFSDTCVYWIHRALHHRLLYAPIHKLHHKYKETTPFSAYAFHPLDGWLQGCPYHMFVFLFPMHHVTYFLSLAVVGLWTINIHDRTSLRVPFVNGAAHHTVHHTGFNYNYGQYFVFWDRIGGSFRDPYKVAPYNGQKLKERGQIASIKKTR
jgi:lathosterol oxidase|tara:strand:+ start:592 stop:1500 length:909 start_codon:yes stop_codon:yes gene_type:complete